MLNAAFVVLRELAELLLIALAVLGCAKSDRRQGLRWVVAASIGAGMAAGSAAMAFVRGSQFDPRVEALCAILLGGATLWMASTILFSNHAVRDYVQTVVEGLPGSGTGRVSMAMLSAFCAFAGFRESMEVWMFLAQAAASHSAMDLAMGAAAGVAILVLALVALQPVVLRVRWLTLYRLSTVGLCFVSLRLLLGGIADLLAASPAAQAAWLEFLQAHAVQAMRDSATALIATLVPAVFLLRRWWRESSAM